jgi:hypothetical protein
MSLIRLVPAGIHAVGDYAAGLVLLIVGLAAGGPDSAKATGIVLGAALILVSLLTRYPLGAVRVIPFPIHSAGDYLGGIAAVLAPFVLGFYDDNKGVAATYIVVGAVVIALSLVTDYSWGPDRQRVAADRRTPARAGR